MEKEVNILWIKIEESTGLRFINRKNLPEVQENYSDETKVLIKKLSYLDQ